jgi:hypothetical protein
MIVTIHAKASVVNASESTLREVVGDLQRGLMKLWIVIRNPCIDGLVRDLVVDAELKLLVRWRASIALFLLDERPLVRYLLEMGLFENYRD